MKSLAIALLGGITALVLTACGQEQATASAMAAAATPAYLGAAYAPTLKKQPSVAAMTALGRIMFSDPSLSASGKMSCATCHSPDHAFGPPNNLAVQLGGKELKILGTRAVPSLR